MDTTEIKSYLQELQSRICAQIEDVSNDGHKFKSDKWNKDTISGDSRIITGKVIEKGGVNFSHVSGGTLPKAASKIRPDLAGANFTAMGVSLVLHTMNPFVPMTHMNVRFINTVTKDEQELWWFGGGFDLTPYYPFDEDCLHWHQVAHDLCSPFGHEVYKKYKKVCDEYFYLPHRNETRGIGGLFFDDLNSWGLDNCFNFMKAVGDGFLDAYIPILMKRKDTHYTEAQKDFQLYRRGRYAEFNLLYDRGTHFGLQSNGRAESILMSLPPETKWGYKWAPEENSLESKLQDYLSPRDWLSQEKAKDTVIA